MDISKRYRQLKYDSTSGLESKIRSFLPTPNKVDYERGYVTRFFIQRSNDSSAVVYEVSDVEYSRLESNALFNGTSLRWRISGPNEIIYDKNNVVTDKGVIESNRISVKLASENMPNLKLYLPNLKQFKQNG